MSITKDDQKLVFHINKFLDFAAEGQTAATKATLEETTSKLSKIFGVSSTSVPDFLDLDYGNELPEILKAGVDELKAGQYETDLAECQSNPHYAAYASVIVSRQYLSGTVEGSVENLRRKARMVAKFKEHVLFFFFLFIFFK